MADAPSIGSEITDIDGKKWKRIILEPPRAQVDSIKNIDINDAKKFAEVTGKKMGTMGELFDESRRLSQAREEKYGIDNIKENYIKEKNDKLAARKQRNRNKKVKK